MRVLLLNQAFYPDRVATAQYLDDMATELTRRGFDVTVICSARGYEDKSLFFPREELHKGVRIYRVWSTGFGKKYRLFRVFDFASFLLSLSIQLFRIPHQEVVLSFTSPPLIGFIGTLYCLLYRARPIQWLMDINPDLAFSAGYIRNTGWIANVLTWAFEFSLDRCECVVVMDAWMKERVARHGISSTKIVVIPLWPLESTPPSFRLEKSRLVLGRYGIATEDFVVLYSGNHSVVHPLDTLLEAASILKEETNIRFVFAGAGIRTAEIERAKKNQALSHIVQLPSFSREEYIQILREANLNIAIMGNSVLGLVHSSKIYSILSAGSPYVFIGPKRSHVGEVLHACPFGYHVEHRNVEGLVEIIREAMRLSRSDLQKISENNRSYVRSNFSLNGAMQMVEDVLMRSFVPPRVNQRVNAI